MAALGSANAVDSMFNGKLTGIREQTVCSPAIVMGPVRDLLGTINFDPCWAPVSDVNPVKGHLVPWEDMWTTMREFVVGEVLADATDTVTAATKAYIKAATDLVPTVGQAVSAVSIVALDPDVADVSPGDKASAMVRAQLVFEAQALVYCELRSSDATPSARKLRKKTEAKLRELYGHLSGHRAEWVDGTYVNPPYGNRGPYTLLGTFEDFCKAFYETTAETVMLCPNRSHREWWCDYVIGGSTTITNLKPIKFDGFEQSFPAPLVLAYKGDKDPRRVATAFRSLGKTVLSGFVEPYNE